MKCQDLVEEEYGKELIMLIKEFFQFYNMDYTNCVFASEANMRDEVKRETLALKDSAGNPILEDNGLFVHIVVLIKPFYSTYKPLFERDV